MKKLFLPVCIPKSQNHRPKKHKKGIHDERATGLKNQSPGSDSSLLKSLQPATKLPANITTVSLNKVCPSTSQSCLASDKTKSEYL